MKIGKVIIVSSLLAISLFGAEFKSYDALSKSLKEEAKKEGTLASTQDVKDALASKEWAVVDVRTMEEWSAGSIAGSMRVGREAPEKALENIVLVQVAANNFSQLNDLLPTPEVRILRQLVNTKYFGSNTDTRPYSSSRRFWSGVAVRRIDFCDHF